MIRESRSPYLREDLSAAFNLLLKHTYDYDYFKPISWKIGKTWYLQTCEFLKWLEKYPDSFSDPSSLIKKGHLYTALGYWNYFNYHYAAAIDYNFEAIKARRASHPEISPKCAFDYASIGFCYYKLGRPREGLRFLNQVEQILRKSREEYPLEFSSFLDVKGLCHYDLREYEEALKCYQEGVLINQQHQGDKHVQGLFSFDSMTYCLLGNMGRCLRDMGRYEEAMVYFDQAIPLGIKTCGRSHPYNLAYTAEKGYLILKMGHTKEALKIMQDALKDYNSLNGQETGEHVSVWHLIGMAYLHSNNTKKAKEMFKKASTCSKKYFCPEKVVMMKAYGGLGWTYLKERKIRKGLSCLLQQLNMCVRYEMKPENTIPIFEDFQQALTKALQIPSSTPHVQKASQEAALLSEQILGKDHPLTSFFLQTQNKI